MPVVVSVTCMGVLRPPVGVPVMIVIVVMIAVPTTGCPTMGVPMARVRAQ